MFLASRSAPTLSLNSDHCRHNIMSSSPDSELREDFDRLWAQAMAQAAARVLEGINLSMDSHPSDSREARSLETMRSTVETLIQQSSYTCDQREP